MRIATAPLGDALAVVTGRPRWRRRHAATPHSMARPGPQAYVACGVMGTSRESASAAVRWRTQAWYSGMDSMARNAAADG